jgi:hypothetical protein
MGDACEVFGQPAGPFSSRVLGAHSANPFESNFTPAGEKKFTPINGGANPPYSVPEILYSASTAAPAPKKSPVPLKPLIGTGFTFNVTTGTAEATPADQHPTPTPTKTRHRNTLRISILSSIDDRSASIREAEIPTCVVAAASRFQASNPSSGPGRCLETNGVMAQRYPHRPTPATLSRQTKPAWARQTGPITRPDAPAWLSSQPGSGCSGHGSIAAHSASRLADKSTLRSTKPLSMPRA